MAYLFIIMLAVNMPVGYYLCRRFQLHRFWPIVLLGIGQYLASALLLATWMVWSYHGPKNLESLVTIFFLWLSGAWFYSFVGFPLVLAYAWFLARYFRQPR